jgi:2-polyprenyl-3-methyl-5-hydroxy-6-metoxy-1,4-benzoquinol methylase
VEPLKGLRILDVGCGGGLLVEPLARLGASVTGIDPSPENIGIAISHSLLDPLVKDRVKYRAITGTILNCL